MKLKSKTGKTRVCAVVKANAYGHGAVCLARLYSSLGCDFFAVSNICEAMELRAFGISEEILILGYTPPECACALSENNITQAVFSREFAEALSAQACLSGVKVKSHLKFDTGMGRIGFCTEKKAENSLEDALFSSTLGGLLVTGAFTHFAAADNSSDKMRAFTKMQAERFSSAAGYLKSLGVCLDICHASNSAAVLDLPEYGFDMVRLGISLYGLSPSHNIRNKLFLKPIGSLKSVISQIKTVNPGETVSYGRAFKASAPTRVATVPVGYADGLFRSAGAGGVRFTVHGKGARILGRVCMDQVMIDVSDIENVKPFDEVLIFGGDAFESADTMAEKCGTIGYEAVTSISARVPRFYKKNGRMCAVLLGKSVYSL